MKALNCPGSARLIINFHSKMLFCETWHGKIPIFPTKIFFGKHNHAGGYFSYRLVWILYSPSEILAQEAGPAAAPHHEASGNHKNPPVFPDPNKNGFKSILNQSALQCPFQPPYLSSGILIPSPEEQKQTVGAFRHQ